jgi:hypothetical protein
MGIKLLVKKDRDKNEYRHYLQEYKLTKADPDVAITWLTSDDTLCPEHTSYLVEYTNATTDDIDSINYITGSSEITFGKAGRVDV